MMQNTKNFFINTTNFRSGVLKNTQQLASDESLIQDRNLNQEISLIPKPYNIPERNKQTTQGQQKQQKPMKSNQEL